MATNKSSSPHSYQIISSIKSSKLVSKSSESLSNIEHQSPQQSNKSTKMKKSLTVLNGFETKSIQTPQTSLNSTSVLRRRFSLFRIKRPQPQQQQQSSINDISNENSNVQALQQIIDQLRHDLKNKTDELETMRQHIEKKCTSISIPSNESIEQAMQLQTMLNGRLEEMLIENDFLKKSIQELEIFAQQQKCKL
ncbi:unnamed protein product [Rotaria sordida]|uniref:Uncharacterized protein n=1 Tax=Rotaria sordida TaxID=392033 RepID=A0A818HV45_9BILA|nr:unnamed protein product [Rotaria sordida]CAF1143478.1 unnamed protein product [Rotaria sordida]CAF3512594.1 unnamed protein product [Rotaria sordida]CAF3742050.1 unnamed protein product [Rotaria sordida]